MACTAQARHCWEYDGQLWRETGRTVVEHNMGAMVNYEGDLVLIGNTLCEKFGDLGLQLFV